MPLNDDAERYERDIRGRLAARDAAARETKIGRCGHEL
jgi:hypothetical protein